MINIKNKKGYTFIEIIIVLMIISVILAITLFSFNAIKNKQSLDKQIDLIKIVINEARQSALNAKNGQDQIVVFGTTSVMYGNRAFNLENNVQLKSYTTGTNTIKFYRVTGLASATGSLEYVINQDDGKISTSSIMINALGIIE